MKLSFPSLTAALAFGLLVLMNSAARLSAPLIQSASPTPTITPAQVAPGPAGDTNGIAFLGILIFVVIVAAIFVRLREAQAH
ncbi:MAG: hypothetical protein RMJ85_10420 [Anaerolineales bacterium]|nr:hypothetical protein [Anaerolineales bacterium]